MSTDERLSLFLAQGEERDEPVIPDGLSRRTLEAIPSLSSIPEPKASNVKVMPDGSIVVLVQSGNSWPNSLGDRGWGLVVPSDAKLSTLLIDSIRPLIEWRAQQMGLVNGDALLRKNVYRVSADPLLSETDAREWIRTVYQEEDSPSPRSSNLRPQYLLILGDLHQVPETISRMLAQGTCYVGRLAFSDNDGNPLPDLYRRYAEKVCAAENPSKLLAPRSGRAGIYGVCDGTPATKAGWAQMVQPMHERARKPDRNFHTENINAADAAEMRSRDQLWDVAANLPASVLFTMSHGYGGPSMGWADPIKQRQLQGGMCFLRGEPRLTINDAQSMQRPFLPNGIWFMFACYGAGTPPRSQFHSWLKEMPPAVIGPNPDWVKRALPQEGAGYRAFVSALPQHLLAKEDGPLAFIGHLDLAWGYGFQTRTGGSNSDPFLSVMDDLLAGSRIGLAMERLRFKREDAEDDLLNGYSRYQDLKLRGLLSEWTPDEELRKQENWMRRQDLGAYVVLGDPAARLPLKVRWLDNDLDDAPKSQPESTLNVAAVAVAGSPAAAPEVVKTEAAPEAAKPEAAAPEVAKPQTVGFSPDAAPEDTDKRKIAEAPTISTQLAALPYWKVEELLAECILGELGPAALARKYGLQKREVEQLATHYRSVGRAALLSLVPDWDRP